MAYIDLATEAMLAVSDAWVRPGEVRTRLEKYKPLGGILEILEEVHADLLGISTQLAANKDEATLAVLTERALEVDRVHDGAVRTGLCLIEAAMLAATTEDGRENLRALRTNLYPQGGALVNFSHTEEAGAAIALQQRLKENPSLRKQALKIKLTFETLSGEANTVTLASLLDTQINAGTELAEIGKEKGKLSTSAPMAPEGTRGGPAQLTSARSAWVRVVSAMVNAANEMKKLTEKDRRLIFGQLSIALEGVERKGKPASKVEKPEDPK